MTYDPTSLTRTLPAGPAIGPPSRYQRGSSEWYIERLGRSLAKRHARFKLLTEYYRGTQNLQRLASEAFVEAGLPTVFPEYLSANYSRLIVNAAAQRLVVLGFRLGGEIQADTEAARIWRANDMEALSDVALTESLVKGECPVLVEPNRADPRTPVITPQDPDEVIVWTARRDRRDRQVALKTWWDEDESRRMYTLYFPDRIERWQDRQRGQMDLFRELLTGSPTPEYERRETRAEPAVVQNPLGEVPIVVLTNEPLLSGSPEAEHEAALTQMDHYNRVLMDMSVTSQELAFPQRWGKGVPDDGEETAEGEVHGAKPAKTGQTRWVLTNSPDAEFGQFAAATIDNYVKELDIIRAGIATITFTPYHFLLNMPSSVPPSGEAITAADAAPTDKAKGHQRDKGTAWRAVMRMCFTIAGDDRRAEAMRQGVTLWMDPERRTESQHVDALGKLRTMLGVPEEAAWEMIPTAPEEIARWKQMRAAEPPAPAAATPGAPPNEPIGLARTAGGT